MESKMTARNLAERRHSVGASYRKSGGREPIQEREKKDGKGFRCRKSKAMVCPERLVLSDWRS